MDYSRAFFDSTWFITYEWDGSGGQAFITFRNDGTFVTSDGGSGRFFQIGRDAVWAFRGRKGQPDWAVVYSTKVSENGKGLTGIQGWSHTSGSPKGSHSGSRNLTFEEEPKVLKSEGKYAIDGVVIGNT